MRRSSSHASARFALLSGGGNRSRRSRGGVGNASAPSAGLPRAAADSVAPGGYPPSPGGSIETLRGNLQSLPGIFPSPRGSSISPTGIPQVQAGSRQTPGGFQRSLSGLGDSLPGNLLRSHSESI